MAEFVLLSLVAGLCVWLITSAWRGPKELRDIESRDPRKPHLIVELRHVTHQPNVIIDAEFEDDRAIRIDEVI